MRITIPFELIDNHVVFTYDGLAFLFDTGAPISCARGHLGEGSTRATLPWFSQPVQVGGTNGVTVEQIVRAIREVCADAALAESFSFDVLLGTDLLKGCRVVIDWSRRVMTVEGGPNGGGDPPRGAGSVPVVDVKINGVWTKAYADTGARISYAHRALLEGCKPARSVRDFNFLGGVEVQFLDITMRRAAVELNGATVEVELGEVAGAVEAGLYSKSVGAILGPNVLAAVGFNTFDFRQ